MQEEFNLELETKKRQALLQKARDVMLEKRTKQEMEIRVWGIELRKIPDQSILSDLNLPEVIELKSFIPELYVEEPKQEIIDKQYAALNAILSKVNTIAVRYNEEADKCMQELEGLNSSQS